ncbi:MAG: hypothetical protein V1862_00140 [Methanobacteriota archaeon]
MTHLKNIITLAPEFERIISYPRDGVRVEIRVLAGCCEEESDGL